VTDPSPTRPKPVPVDLPVARPERVIVALSTAPDLEQARRIAHVLVEEHLAACVNLLGSMESIYLWQGKTEQSAEVGLIIKTTRSRFPALERRLRAIHPYELPELIGWDIDAGSVAFIDWVIAQSRAPRTS